MHNGAGEHSVWSLVDALSNGPFIHRSLLVHEGGLILFIYVNRRFVAIAAFQFLEM